MTLQEQIEQLILETISPTQTPTDAENEALTDKLLELYQGLREDVTLDSQIQVSTPTKDNPVLEINTDPVFLLERQVNPTE